MTGWFASDDRTPVELGECLCPGTPHEGGDTVWLRSELDMGGGFAAAGLVLSGGTLEETLGRGYLVAGVVDWTFVDESGNKVPPTRANISRLKFNDAIYRVADAAADLYGDTVLRPLVARLSRSSRNGSTGKSTSPRKRSTGSPRKRS